MMSDDTIKVSRVMVNMLDFCAKPADLAKFIARRTLTMHEIINIIQTCIDNGYADSAQVMFSTYDIDPSVLKMTYVYCERCIDLVNNIKSMRLVVTDRS
jgi:predicted AlkP superfamily phosphohydrolase/phosphomutase